MAPDSVNGRTPNDPTGSDASSVSCAGPRHMRQTSAHEAQYPSIKGLALFAGKQGARQGGAHSARQGPENDEATPTAWTKLAVSTSISSSISDALTSRATPLKMNGQSGSQGTAHLRVTNRLHGQQ